MNIEKKRKSERKEKKVQVIDFPESRTLSVYKVSHFKKGAAAAAKTDRTIVGCSLFASTSLDIASDCHG